MNYAIDNFNSQITADADIRNIVHSMIYGSSAEHARGEVVVLQKLIRDSKGPIKAPTSYLSGEGSNRDRHSTTRTGYLCEESLCRLLKRPAGRAGGTIVDEATSYMGEFVTNRMVFYMSYKDSIQEHDVIIIPKKDANDNLLQPVQVGLELNVVMVYPMRLDDGRTEFYTIVAEKQK